MDEFVNSPTTVLTFRVGNLFDLDECPTGIQHLISCIVKWFTAYIKKSNLQVLICWLLFQQLWLTKVIILLNGWNQRNCKTQRNFWSSKSRSVGTKLRTSCQCASILHKCIRSNGCIGQDTDFMFGPLNPILVHGVLSRAGKMLISGSKMVMETRESQKWRKVLPSNSLVGIRRPYLAPHGILSKIYLANSSLWTFTSPIIFIHTFIHPAGKLYGLSKEISRTDFQPR